jgi:hypothetical protein
MQVFTSSGQKYDLTERNFVAQGGEGSIYTIPPLAFKVYTDQSQVTPMGKIQELHEITDPRVIIPKDILKDKKGNLVGYTMQFIPHSYALCQLFPRSFRDRERVTPNTIQKLVKQMQETVDNIHRSRVLIVDLNELNFLVSHSFDTVYFIDADSYQTEHFPAKVLMESVRDWSVPNQNWTTLSDWFSFAIVSFQMFVGIHPYKGKYKGSVDQFKTKLPGDPLDDSFSVTRRRMQHNISVLHPEVSIPASAYPLGVIPKAYAKWYEDIFVKGHRSAPPDSFESVTLVFMPKTIVSGSSVSVELLNSLEGSIRGYFGCFNDSVIFSEKGVWLSNQRIPIPFEPSVCGFSDKNHRAIVGKTARQKLQLYNLTDRCPMSFDLEVLESSCYANRIYVRTVDQVREIMLQDLGSQTLVTSKLIVNTLEHSTKLYSGVVIQNLLGSTYVNLLLSSGASNQIQLSELDAYRIMDAKFDSGVLMVLGVDKKGNYDRLVFRFDFSFDSYDVRVISGVSQGGLNFVTLDSGVCVCLTSNEEFELFSSRKDSATIKIIEDNAISGDMQLFKQGVRLLAAQENKLYGLKMVK